LSLTNMGFRKTGTFHPAQEVLVMTCDICERDIGYEDSGCLAQEAARAHSAGSAGLSECMQLMML
jgi:hypothetical protein